MSRKTRGDSKLDALAPAQKEKLSEWLTVENVTYEKAAERCLAEFGVSTTLSALRSFWVRVARPWQYMKSRSEADAIAQLLDGRFDEATAKKVHQLAFEALSDRTPDLKSAKTLLKIIADSARVRLAEQKVSLDMRRVTLLEQKAAEADSARKVAADATLTPEQQLQRYKQIFGG